MLRQKKLSVEFSAVSTISATFDSAVLAGSTIVATIAAWKSGGTHSITSFIDNELLTYNAVRSDLLCGPALEVLMNIYYHHGSAGGGSWQVSAGFNQTVSGTIGIMEYTGLSGVPSVNSGKAHGLMMHSGYLNHGSIAAHIGMMCYDATGGNFQVHDGCGFNEEYEIDEDNTQQGQFVSIRDGVNGSQQAVWWGPFLVWHGTILAAFSDSSVSLEQEGFRWRNDDGSEAAATWAAAQDAALTGPLGTRRLRLLINATGKPSRVGYRLDYRLGSDAWKLVEKK